MAFIDEAQAIIGTAQVLTGLDAAGYGRDFMGKYHCQPLCVLRPGSTAEVAALMALADRTETPIVPISGNTGLAGGTYAPDTVLLSLERLNKIREIRPEARLAVVEAGVVIAALHEATAGHGLTFPLSFGAKGSAMVGGALSTNAGGSNVLRYGNTRALCLGIEVVLPDGEIMDLMSGLHKDNTGYDLRDLFIGAEGTLGIITAAVVKLVPLPAAFATAMVAMPALSDALALLNRLQQASGGAVEAFEFMPGQYIGDHLAYDPTAREPFEDRYDVNIMIELGATSPEDASPGPDGTLPVVALLEEVLGDELEQGRVLDAVIAQSEAQRAEMWSRRESTAAVSLGKSPILVNDIALPLDRVQGFFDRMDAALPAIDAGAETTSVAHLGDGNIHYVIYPSSADPAHMDAVMEATEEIVRDLGGTFSAEHGIGLTKKPSMARRKDPVALKTMWRIKRALDPKGIMNPGKVLPEV